MSDNGEAKPGTYQITTRDLPFLEGATVAALGGLLAHPSPEGQVLTSSGGKPGIGMVLDKKLAAILAVDYAAATLIELRRRLTPVGGKGGPKGVVEPIKPEKGEKK